MIKAKTGYTKTCRYRKTRDYLQNALISLIPLLGFLIFGMIPFMTSAYLSFTELHSSNLADAVWVGFKNFEQIFIDEDGMMRYSYLTTLVLMINVPVSIFLGLYLACLLNKVVKGRKFFRIVVFFPYVCSTMVVSFIFKLLYINDYGILNMGLRKLGFEGVNWLSGTDWNFLISAILMIIWSGLGLVVVLFQSALANVDKNYYEAAQIDGASDRVIFWKITLPAITPILSYLITMKLIWALQSMTETWTLAGGANTIIPYWSGTEIQVHNTVVTRLYRMAFTQSYTYGHGIAAAAAWVLTVVILIVTQINMKLQKRWVCYDF